MDPSAPETCWRQHLGSVRRRNIGLRPWSVCRRELLPALSERQRRRRADSHLWLRRRHQRAGRRDTDPHPDQSRAQTQTLAARPWSSVWAARNWIRNDSFREGAPAPTLMRLQDDAYQGFGPWSKAIVRHVPRPPGNPNRRERETCPVSDLTVGLPVRRQRLVLGSVTAQSRRLVSPRLLVRAGGTVMFSEVDRGARRHHLLTARAADDEVADALVRRDGMYDAYLARGGADRSANTTRRQQKRRPVNHRREGLGLHHQVRQPARSSQVLAPGAAPTKHGMIFAATTGQRFRLRHASTGIRHQPAGLHHRRGTPYGLAAAPVLKVASNSTLAAGGTT